VLTLIDAPNAPLDPLLPETKVWDKRNNALQEKLQLLTQERVQLQAKLEKHEITKKQIDDIQTFARQIGDSINLAGSNYKVKRRNIEMLNVEVALCVDDQGQRYAQASCVLGEMDLSIESKSMSGSSSTTAARKMITNPQESGSHCIIGRKNLPSCAPTFPAKYPDDCC
jgi:hypothetical protein